MSAKIHIRETLEQDSWDQAIWKHENSNIFSSWHWGEYKTRTGWKVHRLMVKDEADDALALLQYHEKRKGFLRLIRVQGGPLLTSKGEKRAEIALRGFMHHLNLGAFDLLVIDFERSQNPAAILAVLACGFKPVVRPIHHTLDVDLTAGLDAVRRDMEPRWKKALKRAEQWPGLAARFIEEKSERLACFDAFSVMYGELKRRANFKNPFDCALYRDIAASDPRHLMLEVRDAGELVLVRIAHMSAHRCTDFLTASTEQARPSNAATLAVWRIIQHASLAGCKTFDHGGIDPAGARGVFDFKVGLTRNVVQSGSMWVYARTAVFRDLVGAYQAFG